MPPPPYYVNFSATLETLMRESRYLDRMGFTVPEKALNVTLQQVGGVSLCTVCMLLPSPTMHLAQ
jgi:hypothetical protein